MGLRQSVWCSHGRVEDASDDFSPYRLPHGIFTFRQVSLNPTRIRRSTSLLVCPSICCRNPDLSFANRNVSELCGGLYPAGLFFSFFFRPGDTGPVAREESPDTRRGFSTLPILRPATPVFPTRTFRQRPTPSHIQRFALLQSPRRAIRFPGNQVRSPGIRYSLSRRFSVSPRATCLGFPNNSEDSDDSFSRY